MIELIYSVPPWVVAAGVVALTFVLAAVGALVFDAFERRRNAAAAARWNARMVAAEQRRAQATVPRAATGPTVRLADCAVHDYPPGANFCIKCRRPA